MESRRVGKQTVVFSKPAVILSSYSSVGPVEGQGPLASSFDLIWKDTINGQKSWEWAESKLLESALQGALQKAGIQSDDVDYMLAGDLLNQTISSNFAARSMALPFIGLFGACSTMALSMAVGSMLIDGLFARKVLLGVSSHHDAAERQFRMPTEQGTQRAMSAQWTVTGAGSLLLGESGSGPRITAATLGRVIDYGETDTNNMGASMAPAVCDTILNHFTDLNRSPQDYDLIITGDLGSVGSALAREVLKKSGYDMGNNFNDCGMLVYSPNQDMHAGGSGCGCSAVVFAGKIMQDLSAGRLKRVMLVGSGSLHSPTSALQGESMPAIGHAVVIEA